MPQQQTIQILDPKEAIKIAAGEVIERPAHIIKELIENSVDAQATEITVFVTKAGKNSIKITDNGYGMPPQDAKLCIVQHATSKITQLDDLESIITYGFRGEALASIASVSHVQITTRTAHEKLATHITVEHGSVKQQTETAHPTGTTIEISNLFEQIPARKKFLKTDETEFNAIVQIFQAFALRYPDITFKLYHNNKLSYNCPATKDLITRASQLFSSNLHTHLITLNPTEQQNVSISGIISDAKHYRYNRNQVITFVNNRWVKNTELARATIKGYQNLLPPQKYPSAFIFISVDPKNVDINIHPKKEEVRFLHPRKIEQLIQQAVTEALNKQVNQYLETKQPITGQLQANSLHTSKQTTFSLPQTKSTTTQHHKHDHAAKSISLNTSTKNSSSQSLPQTSATKLFDQAKQPETHQESATPVVENQTVHDQEPCTIIGQYKATYILIEKDHQLIIIDQHAAHERILYEQLKKNFNNVVTVQLLFPHIIKMSPHEIKIAIQHTKLFASHGIVFEQFSDHELILQATPVHLKSKPVEELIFTALAWIEQHGSAEKQQLFKQLNETIHAKAACSSACKAGDKLTYEQMHNIVTTLQTIENRFCCPHGRPTLYHLPLKELEKNFKRDYQSTGATNAWCDVF